MSNTVRILIGGMGAAALPLVELAESERERLLRDYGFCFSIVGVSDSRGAAWDNGGIAPADILAAKKLHGTVAALPAIGRASATALDTILNTNADIYIDALPPFLPTGEPGRTCIRTAMERGMHVVTANKAPLALYWGELFGVAAETGRQLRYGAAASSALSTLEMGRTLGDSGELLEFSGIFNSSCMYVIQSMRDGLSYEEALRGAREGGFLDPDYATDIDGWDPAMKTVIQANTYWNAALTLHDVERAGIRHLTREDILDAEAAGEVWCMVSHAKRTEDGEIRLSVGPERLPKSHPLAATRWCDKALYIRTRTQGKQVHFGLGASASGTPGNMFLDAVLIARSLG